MSYEMKTCFPKQDMQQEKGIYPISFLNSVEKTKGAIVLFKLSMRPSDAVQLYSIREKISNCALLS